jgi:branched-chain amino acid aminotransferase
MSDDTWIWIDGAVVPAVQARVPVLDRGFLYGDSVFEVTRTVDKQPLFFAEHLERLARSAAAMGYEVPSRAEIFSATEQALSRVAAAEAYLRIIVTRGAGAIDLDPAAADAPRLIVIAKPLKLPEAALYEHGVALCTVGERRNAPGHVPPEVKSSNYLPSVLALRSAKQRGAYEALMCDLSGNICEGASSNFFILRKEALYTPPLSLGILSGVTRAAVLSLCRDEGLPVVEAPFRPSEAQAAAEAFLTSSIRGILPVVRLDDKPIGDGQPGPLSRHIMQRYKARYLERNSSASPTRNSSSSSPK